MTDDVDRMGRTVLDLFAPPVGRFADYLFIGGVAVTHDLSTAQLAGAVLPTLLGVVSTDPRRRLLETRSAGAEHPLVVLAAGDRIDRRGPALPSVTVVPVHGRRLHAKFGVLQFAREGGDSIITRAYVTSANLTAAGLMSNHEFSVVDECTRSVRTHLVFDLLAALDALRRELDNNSGVDLRHVLRSLRRGVAPNGRSTGAVQHSLNAPKDLTAAWARDVRSASSEIATVTLVSPGFAAPSDAVDVKGLDAVLGTADRVRLITSTDDDGHPECSPALLRKLRQRILSIETVPSNDDPQIAPRRLHAKLLSAHLGRWQFVQVGSANLTRQGLAGLNRELVYRTRIRAEAADELVAGLSTEQNDLEPVAPTDQRRVETVEAPRNSISARFQLHPLSRPTELRWRGSLELEFDGERPESLWHTGEVIEVAESQLLVLDSNCPLLFAQYQSEAPDLEVTVEVLPPEGHDEFWSEIGDGEETTDDDHVLQLLFSDIRVAATRSAVPASLPVGISAADDRYRIPLEQRLVRLVRHRDRLDVEVPQATLRSAVEHYLELDGLEAVQVGIAAVAPLEADGSDRLLAALAGAATVLRSEQSDR